MKMRNVIWLAVLACLSATFAWAQLYSGSATGLITDPSGASVPGAKVSLVDEDKGFVFNTEADASGRYLFRAVPPASYKITVTAAGFQVQTRGGVRIDISQNVTVDFSLPLTTSVETVNISAEAPILATEDASTGQVVDRRFINDLPLVGRDITGLAYLAPGVVSPFNGSPWGGNYGNAFSSSGGRAATADVLLDGTSTTNYEQNGGTLVVSYLPAPDAIQEFKVQTSQFSAEFGFTGSTVVNMVMRSGTNSFHGVAYEYLQNNKLDANNFFNNESGTALPGLRRNNFGGAIGGPIKRNKTFFFFDYDGLRQLNSTTATYGVPSGPERQGNFGELCGYQGGTFDSAGMCSAQAGQLWDPYSGTYNANAGGAVRSTYIPFNNLATYMSPGNPNLNGTGYQLAPTPGNLIDPVASKMMQYYPMPNLNVGTASYQYFANWVGSGANLSNHNQFDVKIDHSFSDKTLLSGKFSVQHIFNHGWNCFGNEGDSCEAGPDPNHSYLGSLNLTHTFTPTLLLTVSYGYNRWHELESTIMGDYPNVDPVKLLGLPSYMKESGLDVFPAITVGDAYANYDGTSVGTWPWTYIVRGQDTHQLLGTVSWIKGSHELKFGAESRMHRVNFDLPGPTTGDFTFNYSSTSQNPNYGSGGDAMASFLTGVGSNQSYGVYEVPSSFASQNLQWGGFIQDNWKIRRNLTVNIGLRYDVTLPRTERFNHQNWVDPNAVSPLQVPGMGTLYGGEVFASASDRQSYEPDLTNFQPRVGFAWQALNKTVIRGGYGVYYSTSRAAVAGVGGTGTGHQGYVEDTPWLTSYHNDGATPWGRLSDPWPITGPNLPPGNSLGLLNDIGFGSYGPLKTANAVPYEQSWSFGIQRELPWNTLLDASYVGKKGTHLYFGGSGQYNILGPQIEQYSPSQIAGLLSYVSNPFHGIITNQNSGLSSSTVQAYQLKLPFPQFTGFGTDDQPVADSIYNGLQVRIQKRFSAGLQFLVTYAYSKALDDASASSNAWYTGSTSLQDPNRRYLERSVSLYDIPQILQLSHTYELPFGHGKKIGGNWNPVVNAFIGGWQINGIWTFDDGRPLLPGFQGSISLPTYGPQRPNLVGTPARNTGSDWMTQYFANPDVFVAPAPFTIGNAPRTLPWVRTPGQRNSNLSLFKDFSLDKIREGMRLQYRIQTTNALNHPQFAGPNMSVGSSSFGTVTSQANSPRVAEMALRLSF